MKRLPLTLAVMLCAMAASASEMAIPDGALMNYRFDNTVTDMVEGNMLMTYDPETGSCTPVDDPEYAKDGGLVLDRYYAVEGDFSIRLYQSQSIAVRMRTGKQIDDAGPLQRFGDADSIWLASVAVKQRREMDEQGRHYTFNGNPVIILISAVGVLCYIILMFRGGGVAFFIGLIQLAVSIAAYLLLAYRPVSQEEFRIPWPIRHVSRRHT